ncbi:protein-tyrosine-phosphatase PTP1 isoform X3 [Cryptomeria japonica]|uniref:protein-tyrosine-phosphatase PTP1 isoform X3 n=1 Tax=Cryptomeria japonica TaxID=3369 RepID=UPI0025AD6A68|nr:protein-tyrosine-phosphatase PTP1 isoform X3 [Cryptomeria japonica]
MAASHKNITIASTSKSIDTNDVLKRASDIARPLRLSLSPSQLSFCSEALEQFKQTLSSRTKVFKEFEALQLGRSRRPELMRRSSVANQHGHKNRYTDVLPFDDTRVVLNCAGNDYINASYIVNTSSENIPKFIATQGPLPETLEDFWEMIIQHRCPVIVMLTQLIDNYKVFYCARFKVVKCADYFPAEEESSRTFGRISVTNTSLKISPNSIAVRLFNVKYVESEEPPLSVLHLQYADWPDHGVPESTNSVRELVKIAGIGRTGAFCTVSHTIHRILEGDLSAIDISETIRQFRTQRIGMVQTREQYSFCYAAIVDELEDLISQQKTS